MGRDEDAGKLCAPCVGFDLPTGCGTCSSSAAAYEGGRCARCVMTDQARRLLTGPGGTVPTQLRPLLRALSEVEEPRTVLAWIRRNSAAHTIAELAAAGAVVDHSTLDALPQTRALNHLRQALIFTGALPERSEYLQRIIPWLEQLISDQPAHRARLIRAFAHWDVLRHARARQREFTQGAAQGAQAKIRVSLRFLTWIEERGLTLAELTQPELEQWLRTHPGTRAYLVSELLRWARKRGLVGPVTITRPPRADPAHFIESDERSPLLRRCLGDQNLALAARTAGALILLYGISVSKLVRLTATDVVEHDSDTYLRIDRRLALLPPKLATLVITQRDHGRAPSALGRTETHPRWLFNGAHPGRPMTSSGLRNHLAALGTHLRAVQNSALISLAEDLPAAILADLLGLNISTAARWTKLAQRDGTDYLAARARDQQPMISGNATHHELPAA